MRFQHQRKVEVVGSWGNGSCSLESSLGHGGNRQSGRKSECLLQPCQYKVDAPCIGFNGGTRHATHCIHQQEHVRILSDNFGDRFQRVHQASGSFVIDESYGVVLAGRQLLVHHLRLYGDIPRQLEGVTGHVISDRDLMPSLGKRSIHQIQAPLGH